MRHEGVRVTADIKLQVCVCVCYIFINVYLIQDVLLTDTLAHAPMADKCLCVCFEVSVYTLECRFLLCFLAGHL